MPLHTFWFQLVLGTGFEPVSTSAIMEFCFKPV